MCCTASCSISQVPVALVSFMHGGDVKLFLFPCAFMLNYAFNGSAISGLNTVSPLLKIRWLFFGAKNLLVSAVC